MTSYSWELLIYSGKESKYLLLRKLLFKCPYKLSCLQNHFSENCHKVGFWDNNKTNIDKNININSNNKIKNKNKKIKKSIITTTKNNKKTTKTTKTTTTTTEQTFLGCDTIKINLVDVIYFTVL